ncbi:MAG: YceI family protein [Solirubrobacteraceae bacterium]|nr:YceI family protein [Solirubrobacteraceae bacterium]
MTNGPQDGSVVVRTSREGRAARMGHDLVIDVTSWSVAGDGDEVVFEVDPRSLTVREGLGGLKALTDADRARIAQTIDDKVLLGLPVRFSSTELSRTDDTLAVTGELTLAGRTRPLRAELRIGDDGVARGTVGVLQTDFGITPQTAMMGGLRVSDRVDVDIAAALP